jgi:hypothetical protein
MLHTYLVNNTVVRLCQFFCCGGKVNFVRIPYSHDRFSKILRTFFVKNTRYAWAGGTFFPVVLLCQFSVLAGNRFWFYIHLMYLEYHTVVVLCYVVFFNLVGNSFWYVRT